MEQIEIEQLQQENEQLKSENETLKQVNDDLGKKIEELSAAKTISEAGKKAQEKVSAMIPGESFDVDNVKYGFAVPAFMWKGKKISSIDALKDESLLNELVKVKAGVIVKK